MNFKYRLREQEEGGEEESGLKQLKAKTELILTALGDYTADKLVDVINDPSNLKGTFVLRSEGLKELERKVFGDTKASNDVNKNIYQENGGELYRQPINVLLQTINLESDQDRMSKVLNELAVYDWVPEIKVFVHNLTKSPQQRSNLLSGGKSESVFTIVEQVEEKTEFNLELTLVPADKKIPILKIVRSITGLGLKEAKDLVDSAPKNIQENLTKEAAESAKKQLEEAGAKVTLK